MSDVDPLQKPYNVLLAMLPNANYSHDMLESLIVSRPGEHAYPNEIQTLLQSLANEGLVESGVDGWHLTDAGVQRRDETMPPIDVPTGRRRR